MSEYTREDILKIIEENGEPGGLCEDGCQVERKTLDRGLCICASGVYITRCNRPGGRKPWRWGFCREWKHQN